VDLSNLSLTSKALHAACLHALWRFVTFKLRNSDAVSTFKLEGFPSHRLPFAGGIELSTAAGNKLGGFSHRQNLKRGDGLREHELEDSKIWPESEIIPYYKARDR
jgi:hypothetical protein